MSFTPNPLFLREKLRQLKLSKDTMIHHVNKYIDRAIDRHICLGITGFSGSGKTTFITSFIQQLSQYNNDQLPAFSPALQGRLLGLKVHKLNNHSPLFPYERALQALNQSPPAWPESTVDISGCLLEVRIKPTKRLLTLPGQKYQKLFIELHDYPGEWLIDLPLMHTKFHQWSILSEKLFNQPPRKELLGDLREQFESIDPLAIADISKVQSDYQSFVQFLKRCKNQQKPLYVIQPGRFLTPPEPNTIKPFLPLLNLKHYSIAQLHGAHEKSYYKVFLTNYNHYVDHLVKPFYYDYFSKIDRQVVMVDILRALSSGKYWFTDMQLALDLLFEGFNYGHNNLLSRLFKPNIEQVVFIASKIDQALPCQHENIRALLGNLLHNACCKAKFEQIPVTCEAIAAIRSSHMEKNSGKEVLIGHTKEFGLGKLTHPDIPKKFPTEQEWQQLNQWELPELFPPEYLSEVKSLPHIRLDVIIQKLLGDKC